MKEVLYEVRCLKSNEDMILALAGQLLSLLKVFVDAPGDDHFPCCWIVPSTNFFKVSNSLLQIRRSPLSRRFSSSGPSCLIENNSTVVFSKEPLSELVETGPSAMTCR